MSQYLSKLYYKQTFAICFANFRSKNPHLLTYYPSWSGILSLFPSTFHFMYQFMSVFQILTKLYSVFFQQFSHRNFTLMLLQLSIERTTSFKLLFFVIGKIISFSFTSSLDAPKHVWWHIKFFFSKFSKFQKTPIFFLKFRPFCLNSLSNLCLFKV